MVLQALHASFKPQVAVNTSLMHWIVGAAIPSN